MLIEHSVGFPGGSVIKNLPANAGDAGLIPESGRCPGEGNSNPLQYSCLENPMDRGASWVTVHESQESDMTLSLTHSFSLKVAFSKFVTRLISSCF